MTDDRPPGPNEVIWSPWRLDYLKKERPEGCVFCAIVAADPAGDEERYVVHRGPTCFVVLNRWPYNNGHAMVIPKRHISDVSEETDEEALEMHRLSARLVAAYRKTMQAQGANIGVNLGRASGGSIEHLHLHVVPRWVGDSNFMPVIGRTKVLVEMLSDTWRRLVEEAKGWVGEAG